MNMRGRYSITLNVIWRWPFRGDKENSRKSIVRVCNPTSLFRRKLHKCRPSRAAELWEIPVPVWNRGRDVFFNVQYTQYMGGI